MPSKKLGDFLLSIEPSGFHRVSLAVVFGFLFICTPIDKTFAEEQAADSATIEEVIVLGTRRQEGRSATDSLVPVDFIGGDELGSQGPTDMNSLLSALVPSYNVDQQPINDAATLVRPAKLRGLPPDSTLVLVNRKRRHRAAVITFLGNGVADGSQGPDLSAIPAIAIKHVEVLRDGAAAQYGSDAIAGVINFTLKDSAEGGTVEARFGSHYEGDGDAMTVAANFGLPLTDSGFANVSFEYKQSDPTSRSQQRSDAQALVDAGNRHIPDSSYPHVFHPNVMVWGAPEFLYDYKVFANLGLELGNGREAYAFGNYATRKVEGGFYFRNPHTRTGVFAGPEVTVDGVTYDSVKVADLSPGGIHDDDVCPAIRIMNNVANPQDIAAVEANPNCFSLISAFPGGFVPRFGGTMTDFSMAFGVRGELVDGWEFDASSVFGVNDVDFFMRHTINPQLLAKLPDGQRTEIPINYFPGSYTETDYTLNFDVAKPILIGGLDAHVAFGVEHRREKFKVESGEENSWFIDDRPGGLAEQGFGIGSNGFTGFGPRLAGVFDRNSYAAYADIEIDVNENFTIEVAGRYEDHEDVGNTFDGKFAARLDVNDFVSIRGAASTGFRAPTVGQANILNVTTAFTGGMLADEATLPPTHPAAAIVGAKPLTPEEAVNLTIGTVIELDAVDITIDYFNIQVEDRIARSSNRDLTPADIQQLLAQGVADAQSFSAVRFYTNDFSTTTQGIDVVATYPLDMGVGSTNLSLAFNWTETTVDDRNPDVINDKRVVQLEENLPATRFTVSFNHEQGPWSVSARLRYYDEFVEFSTDDATARHDAEARFIVDSEVAYNFNDSLRLIVGAENLLDEYPSELEQNVSGLVYAETSPFGFNGGFYYLRAIWDR
jgi:iron complex outermembrane receptor protein